VAANSAVQIVLEQLASFCAETATHWQATAAEQQEASKQKSR
jgi:hypothetical protein